MQSNDIHATDALSPDAITVTLTVVQADELFRELRDAVTCSASELAMIGQSYEPDDAEWSQTFRQFDERRALLDQLPASPTDEVTVTASGRLLEERAVLAAGCVMGDIGEFDRPAEDFDMEAALRALDRARELLQLVIDVRQRRARRTLEA